MAYPRTKTAAVVALLAAIPIGLQWSEIRKLRREALPEASAGVPSGSAKSERPRGGSGIGERARGQRNKPAGAQGEAPWTNTAGTGAWQRALQEQDPVRRSLRIAELIATLDRSSAPDIAELFFGEGVDGNFESEAALFLRAWAKMDGWQTVAYLEDKKRAGSASSSMLAALGGWASSEPEAARAWAEAVENGGLRENFLFGVIDGWNLVDFEAAADYAETRPRSEARTRFVELLFQRSMAAGGIAGAQNWFAGISDNDHNTVYKRRAFERIVSTMLKRDPSATAHWIAGQAGGAFVSQQAVRSTALKLAENSHEEALRWISSMPTLRDEVSAASLAKIVSQWAGKDPEAAGDWMSAHANHPAYDAMARDYSAAVAGNDGERAMEWARSINDEAQRQAAVLEVARQRIKAGGDPAIEQLRLAGLSEEEITQASQRRQGIRLSGLNFSNGSFTLSSKSGLGQVLELNTTDQVVPSNPNPGEAAPTPPIPVNPSGSAGK